MTEKSYSREFALGGWLVAVVVGFWGLMMAAAARWMLFRLPDHAQRRVMMDPLGVLVESFDAVIGFKLLLVSIVIFIVWFPVSYYAAELGRRRGGI